jgi:hypothetical protein
MRFVPFSSSATALGALGFLAFGFLSPQAGSAQQPVPEPMNVRPAPDSLQAMMAEYQDKARIYTAIYNEAFAANEDLQMQETAINDLIMAAMIESHPDTEGQMARLDVIETEAFAAQQAQDMDTLGRLIAEANNLQAELRGAQELVLQREDVQSRIESFETSLSVAMVAINPEANVLRVRLDELQAILNRAGL